MNMRAMAKYGMTPYEVLVAATRTPGEFLQEPIGQLQPGYYADLVVLDGNPLERIEDAATVRQVMVGGALYALDDLLAPFAKAPPQARARASRMRPAVAPHPSNDKYWWHDEHYIEEGKRCCCCMV
jgi:cytosine/adenosine deaminase-related metal-dependent hydrolase